MTSLISWQTVGDSTYTWKLSVEKEMKRYIDMAGDMALAASKIVTLECAIFP